MPQIKEDARQTAEIILHQLGGASYETEFATTIKRNGSLVDLIQKGAPYEIQRKMVDLALSEDYEQPIFMENWTLPAGAYGESCGPV